MRVKRLRQRVAKKAKAVLERGKRNGRANISGKRTKRNRKTGGGKKTGGGRRNGGASIGGKRTKRDKKTKGFRRNRRASTNYRKSREEREAGKLALAIGDFGGGGEIREPVSAIGYLEGGRNKRAKASCKRSEEEKIGEPPLAATLSLFSFDYWQALVLVTACFRYCFFFFNCIFFSQGSSSSLSSLSLAAIVSSISLSSSQSALVYPSQSLFFKLYLVLERLTFKSLVGPQCILIVKKIRVAIFEVFSTSFYFNNFSKSLIV